jgi:uncharacterized protein YbjT (DUF2867 family)
MTGVVLAGATGLVGAHALAALNEREIATLALVRRPLKDSRVATATFDGPLEDWRGRDALLIALGTTIKKAGSNEAFAAIDRDLVLKLARRAREATIAQVIAVSSIGADPLARNFYLRIKGEVEGALAALGFARVDLLQPSVLIGARPESRPGEALAQALLPKLGGLLRGPLEPYRAIDAAQVGRAMVALVGAKPPGVFVHRYRELSALGAD